GNKEGKKMLLVGGNMVLSAPDELEDYPLIPMKANTIGFADVQKENLGIPKIKENDVLKPGKLKSNGIADFSPNTPYVIDSKNGFIKMTFEGKTDFGHAGYSKRLIEAAKDKDNTSIPAQPYTPIVKSLYSDYTTSASLDLDSDLKDENASYFQLTPFGPAKRQEATSTNIPLLPAYKNQGELYIGIDDFKPKQTLSLLFKVSDGSANPILKTP